MAYGNYCPVCGGTVDNVEFSYHRGMCKDCAADQDRKDAETIETVKLMRTRHQKIIMEV